jgi:hypothetical protein
MRVEGSHQVWRLEFEGKEFVAGRPLIVVDLVFCLD